VFLLGYSIQLSLPLVVVAALTWVRYESMPPSVRIIFHGIMWPDHWLQGGEVLARNKALVGSDSGIILNNRTIFCNDVFNNWLLMMTFGLCSPVLAVAIVSCVLLKMSLWVMLIGRFTRCIVGSSDGDGGGDEGGDDVVQFALGSLAAEYIPLLEVLAASFWRLAWCSALFVSLVCWDMAMDEVGWLQSVWVPLVPLGFVALLRSVEHCCRVMGGDHDGSGEEAKGSGATASEDSGVSLNPLHIEEQL
jgi:hypothetical protein